MAGAAIINPAKAAVFKEVGQAIQQSTIHWQLGGGSLEQACCQLLRHRQALKSRLHELGRCVEISGLRPLDPAEKRRWLCRELPR